MRYVVLLLMLAMAGNHALAADGPADSAKVISQSGGKARHYIVPSVLGVASAAAWRENGFFSRGAVYRWRQQNFFGFRTRTDNYLQFLPAGVMLVTSAVRGGEPGNFGASVLHLVKAEAIMAAIVYPVKGLTHVERPNRRNFQSFPSGHTAQAFLSATVLHRELASPRFEGMKGRKWMIAGGYLAAAATGTFRIMNNAHWLTDVLAGAAIGMASGNLAYDIRLGRNESVTRVSVMPFWNRGGGLAVRASFQ